MASPFQKYQSEQVQPINILPYTGAMAEQTYKTLAGVGKDIGDSLEKYNYGVKQREEMAKVSQGVIGEHLERVMDEESQDDVVRLKETAPAHIKDLYKKAEKQGNGDWVVGLGGLSNTDFSAFGTLQTKWEKDEQVKYQKTTDATKLAIDQYNATTSRQNSDVNLKQIQLAQRQQRQKELEIEETKRLQKVIQGIQETEVPDIQTLVDIKKTAIPTGDLYDIDGEVIASGVQINDAIDAFGFKKEDIVPEADASRLASEQTDFPVLATGRWLAGNEKFNIKSDFNSSRRADPLATDSFIRKTFLQASYADPSLKDNKAFTQFFERGNIEGQLVDNEVSKTKAYALAQKLASSPSMQNWAKENNVTLIPANALVRKAYITVTGQYEEEERTLRQVDIHPEQQEKNRFEVFKASYERGGKKMPLSWDMYRATQSQKFFPRYYAPDGTPVVTVGNKAIPETMVGVYGSEGPPTAGKEASLEEVQANNWLKGFEKPVKVGNEIWQFVGGARDWKGNFQTSFKTLETGIPDMLRINGIADKMILMQRTGGKLEKVLSPSWKKDYDNLNRQAQTYRRYFIATGQETEPDNARLADILADRELFDSLDPERKIRVIEAFKEIVASKVRGTFQSGGGIVKNASSTKTDIKKLADEAGGRKFEDLQKKYGEPKKA